MGLHFISESAKFGFKPNPFMPIPMQHLLSTLAYGDKGILRPSNVWTKNRDFGVIPVAIPGKQRRKKDRSPR